MAKCLHASEIGVVELALHFLFLLDIHGGSFLLDLYGFLNLGDCQFFLALGEHSEIAERASVTHYKKVSLASVAYRSESCDTAFGNVLLGFGFDASKDLFNTTERAILAPFGKMVYELTCVHGDSP
jgi:hypothetical protein